MHLQIPYDPSVAPASDMNSPAEISLTDRMITQATTIRELRESLANATALNAKLEQLLTSERRRSDSLRDHLTAGEKPTLREEQIAGYAASASYSLARFDSRDKAIEWAMSEANNEPSCDVFALVKIGTAQLTATFLEVEA